MNDNVLHRAKMLEENAELLQKEFREFEGYLSALTLERAQRARQTAEKLLNSLRDDLDRQHFQEAVDAENERIEAKAGMIE